jgi:C-terminal processing protease CtpA/Prc
LLPDLAAAAGVIFDLRGPMRNRAAHVVRHLTEHPVSGGAERILTRTRPDGRDDEWAELPWTVRPAEPRITAPVVCLIDGATVGWAERVVAMLKHHKLATLCGSNTAGAPGNTCVRALPSGVRIAWSATSVTDPAGVDLFYTGVAPDVVAVRKLSGIETGRDEVIEAALRHIEAVQAAPNRSPATTVPSGG